MLDIYMYIYISNNISHNFNPLYIILVLILFIKHVHNMYIYTYLPYIIYINYTYTKRLKCVFFNSQGTSQISHSVAPVSPIKVPVEAAASVIRRVPDRPNGGLGIPKDPFDSSTWWLRFQPS